MSVVWVEAEVNAKTVAIPGSTSGIWLATDLFPRLGIAEKINVKVTPRGTGAAGMVAAGEIEGSKRLIKFLASARASETIKKSGMEPLGTSMVRRDARVANPGIAK